MSPVFEKLEVRSLLAAWDGGGADNNWTTADNWMGNVAPVPGDSLTFPAGAARLTNNNDFASGTAFASINFTGAGYTLGGNALVLSGGLVDNSAQDANNYVALTNITLAASQTFANFHANFGRTFIVTSGVDTNGFVLTIDGTVTTRFEGVVSGSGGITKIGSASLNFEGSVANTYTGTTTVNSGNIVAARTAGVTSISGFVVINTGGQFALLTSNQITDAASVSVNGGSFDLFNNSETIGSLSGTAAGSVNFGNGNANTLTVGGDNSNSSYAGVITGTDPSDGLVKQGTGTITLSGANTYSGATTINAGTLQVGNGGTTGSLGTGAVVDNAILVYNLSSSINVANAISGSGTLHLISGAGVSQSAGITVANLAVEAAGTISLSSSNDADIVALRTTSGNISFEDLDGFTVGTVNGVAGVSSPIGSPNLLAFTGDISVANTSAANDLEGGAGFNMNITLFGAGAKFTIASGANVSGGGAQVTADRMDFLGTLTTTATVTLQPNFVGQLINLGSNGDATLNTLELSDAELDRISAGVIRVGGSNSGTITVSQSVNRSAATNLMLTTGGANSIVFGAAGALNTNGGDVTLTTATGVGSGGVDGNSGTTNITANALAITSGARGVGGLGAYLTTAVSSVMASATNTAIRLAEADSVTIIAPGLSGSLIHLESGTFQYGANNLIPDTSNVDVRFSAVLNLNNFSDQITGLQVYGGPSSGASVATGTGTLTLGANGISYGYGSNGAVGATVSGNLDLGGTTREINVPDGLAATDLTVSAAIGNGGLLKSGAGALAFTGTNTYSGLTTISAGTLSLSSTGTTSATSVTGTGTLKGTGTVGGNLSNASIVAPGNSPGIITINGNYTQSSLGSLDIEIQGTNAAVPDFDQLIVNGTVSLAGTLSISFLNSFIPTNGNTFKIIANDSADAISGTFIGLTEGEIFTIGNTLFGISYAGGDGNDVELTVLSTTYVVTSTADSGAGSLRQAIIDSNAGPGYDTITFNIAGSGVRTISPTTALPTITDAVVINGYTQPGSSANTLTTGNDAVILIELNGTSAGAGANGLTITGGGSLVTGLAIIRFLGMGINIRGAAALNNTLQGNFVGLNASGTTAQANGTWGIFVDGSPNTTIGGTTTGERNLISGNSQGGVAVIGSTATSATIQGNWIGTDVTGSLDLGNAFSGVYVGTATGFGGVTSTGSASQSVIRDNVISGNNNSGVWIRGVGSNQHQVAGNFIGTDTVGGAAIGNSLFGVLIDSGASNNIIGGVSAIDRNVISGNASDGVLITGATTNNNVVIRNYIGTDITGMLDLGNASSGVHVIGGADSNFIGTNGDGVGDQFEGNVISGNDGYGVWIGEQGTDNNVLAGNLIGLSATGNAAIGNTGHAVVVYRGPDNTRLGTNGDGVSDEFERNVISGNTWGIDVEGVDTNGTIIAGNYIGTDVTGMIAIPSDTGVIVRFGAQGTRVGTDGSNDAFNVNERNVISGNYSFGIFVATTNWDGEVPAGGVTTDGTIIAGNYVGLNATGNAVMANTSHGILAANHVTNLQIGTNSDGTSDAEERNVVSGNNGYGMVIDGWTHINLRTADQMVSGAISTTTSSATLSQADFSDQSFGVRGNWKIDNVVPGGGGDFYAMRSTGNLQVNTAGIYTFALSGDEGGRLRIDGVDVIVDESFSGFANAFGSVSLTAGNHSFEWIGLEANGSAAFELSVAVGSGRVAPVTEANGWRILGSANSHAGISLQGSISTTVYYPESGDQNVTIAGNYIGTDATGTLDFGNAGSGVLASAGASGVTIGGSSATSRNLISGNNIGVDIYGRYTKDIWVAGNYIGVGANGNTPVGNSAYGVWINQTFGTILGTNGDGVNDAAEGNVISASGNVGVYVNGDRQVVHNLTIADQLISGKLPSTISSGTIPVADMNDLAGGSVGNWSFNHPVPGGGGDDYVFRAAGQITVTTPGVYTFGLGGDDGTRLRIDGVDVIVDDALHGFLEYFGTVNLTAGTHTFEWVGMERAWNAGWELTVKAGTHITGPANAANGWAVLGDAAAAVSLTGSIAVDVYYAQVIAGEHHVIAGNIIGLNSVGTVTRGNGWSGILIENGAQGTIIGTNGDGISDVLERNIISANAGHGVEIRWSGSDHSIVAGNYIGTDITGTQDFGNTLDGVAVWESARFARIGTNGDGVSDTVEGNLISGNNRYGVYLLGRNVSHNVVAGNLIGTDVSGTLDLGNTQQGVRVENGHSNRIGTDGSGDAFDVVERNVISGNNSYGVYIFGTGAHDNVVAGNLVGTNAAGTAAIENNSGVVVAHGARNTRVGTNADGSSDATERNIISGNVNFGLWLSNTTYTSVAGNYIGTNVTGTSSVANGRGTNGGVMINAGSRYNVIGTNGDGIGDAVEGNLISGNNGYNGLWIEGDSTHYNVVAGNRIGTDVTGTLPLANRGSGIEIKQGASYNRVGTNTDGVSDVLERNIISANQAHGVFIWRQFIPGGVPTNNTIAGNHIGTDITGTIDLGNSSDGVYLGGGATGNTIGGSVVGAGNLISGNNGQGVELNGAGTSNNIVAGNFVGTNVTGTAAVGNSSDGIRVSGSGNRIGGAHPAARNLVSGNGWNGINIDTTNAISNKVQGNYVGLNAAGTGRIANANHGVLIWGGAVGTIVGTNGDGVNDATEGNVISGNTWDEVSFWTGGANQTVIAGNLLGTTADGLSALTRNRYGVWVTQGALNTRVGTNADGVSDELERNIISGGGSDGVRIDVAGVANTTVAGNYIGTDITGTNNNTIGGSVAGARNVISGSLSAGSGRGVLISGAGTSLNTVKGNFIGLDATGMTAIANANSGVLIGSGATNNTIGGPNSGDRNVISGNVLAGIAIQGSGTTGNVAQGNWVGINASGTAAVANLAAGIAFIDSASANSAIGNVVSGNAVYGIGVHKYNTALGANNNIIRGNLIGTDPSGTVAIPNVGIGVSIGDGSSGNIVGGTTSADRNVISGNTDTGIKVNQSTTANNVIQGNYIGITASGATALGNGTGVHVISATGTVIGGAGAGNVISGNGTGILVESFTASPMNTGILGNFIGTNAAGTAAIGNAADGVDIRTAGNTIGGTTALDRNIISGNAQRGISISGAFATNNTVIGSYIGTDLSGIVAIPNSASGIIVSAGASSNTIGGTTIGAGNLISGNAQNGVYLIGAATIGNIVHGNYIGTNAAGTADLGNALDGIRLIAPNNTIGGTTAQAGNVISGNDNAGLWINSGANNTQVSGNLIGTNASGSEALGNTYYGIHVQSNFNQIGGSTAAHRNVVSGTIQNNGGDYVTGAGIAIYDAGFMSVTGNVVRGNYIGTDITGSGAIPNFTSGVTVQTTVAGNHNTIGGSIAGEGNLISGNGIPGGLGAGIYGNSLASPGFSLPNIVSILGNYIGTNATGSIAVPNRGPGIYFYQSPGNIVGGSSSVVNGMLSGAGNLISGNLGNGIHVDNGGSNSNGTVIQGNFIGTDLTGTQAIGNAQIGVATGSSNNIIGSTIANQRNVISGNTHGVSIGSGGTNNQVFGNYIGTDVSGLAAIQNTAFGVWISSAGNSVGGTNPQDGNIIANSGLGGLRLEGVTGNNGTYSNNTYHGNLGLAIDAGTAGRTLNALPDTDGVLNYPVVTSTQIVGSELIVEGTMTSGKTVEIYISAPTADGVGQGRQRLASALDNSLTDENATAGQFKFRIPLGNGLSNGTPLTALTIGSTSEFSPIVFAGQVGSFIAPQITLGATTVSLTSGNAIGVDGSFYDPDSVSWGGTVDYGDGSRVQPLTLNSDNTFRLEHTYVNTGSFIVTVQIRDNSLISSTKSLGVTVQNEAPTASFDEFSITSPASEGQLVTLTGRFEDTGGTHTATIEWGDGSTSILPLGLGIRDFSATHTYHDDSNSEETATPSDVYRVVVTITDESGESDLTPEGLFLEEIINVLPSAMNAVFSSTSITEGQAVTLSSLFFVDPGQLDAHTLNVNWGDGSEPLPITLPLGTRSLADLATLLTPIQLADLLAKLTHIYADDANIGPDEYTITVEVADDDEPQQPAVITKVISVANAIPSAVLASISSTQIQEDGLVSLSGSFFDLGLLDDYVVTIDWGDGTTVSTFPLGAGITTFSGMSHQYINNRTGGGNYAIEVRVMDNDSPTLFGLATASIHVENVAPVLGPLALSSSGNAILEGDRLTLSGRFTDVSMQDRHTVLVNWGDGSVTPATVDAVTRTYTATHQYLDNNATPLLVLVADPIAIISYLPYSISVTVDDHDGGTATATIGQDVYNVAPTVTIEPGLSNTDRNLINLVAGIEDPGTLDTFTHGGAYRWTAEVVGIPGTMQSGSVSTFVVDRTAYPDALWNVSLSVADDDGGTGSFTTTLLVGTNGDDIGANRLIVSDAMFSQSGTFNLMALGLDGNDTIDASGVTDPNFSVTLVGGSGVDNMFGGAGDDVYLLAQGNDNANVPNSDVLNPVEAGSDRYVLRPNSVLTVIDRIGSNSLDFGLADFGITFDLSLTSTTTLVSQDVVPIPMTAPLHIVQTQGSFTRLDGSLFDDHLTAASGASLFGDAGNDTFTAKAGTIGASFHGGADSDILSISAVGISNLDFSGDAGADTLINLGEITGLTFNGGADADILQNDGSILAALSFGGDAGADLLLNSGDIANLTFNGGADNDIFVNNGTATTNLDFNADADILLSGLGSIGTLNFGGDSGADIFVNLGSILDLTFNGGADNDIFVNNGSAVDTLDFGGDLDVLLSGLGTIGELSFNGDAGIDTLINRGSVGDLTFDGGADSDILQNNGTILRELSFEGDAGIDTLINLGSVGVLTFDGGADADVLQNLGTVLGNLSFEGDFGADVLTNTGSLGSLTFRGGADSDILQNNGTVLGALVFRGDAGVDTLLNQGTIGGLSFAGGADADVLRNLGGGTIVRLDFDGDAGADLLVNLSSITHLTFAGGADADILQNIGNITDLNFGGDAGADLLVNSGSVTLLTFRGGADNDILVNTGNVLGQLTFGGHTGLDSLVNDGTLGGLTFNGGADSDILQNTGTIQTTLLFNGDTGIDTLINSGSVLNLTFNGGADSDLLMNTGTVLDLLVFTGDLGSDQLTNLGTVGDLTFNGGADADVLKNTGTILDDLVFNGDIGADLLINGGPIGDLTFDGGADNDVLLNLGSVGTLTFDGGADNDVLQNNGSGIYSLNFIGGADNDVLINNGNSIRLLTFDGGADNDVLVSNGTLIGILEFTGDTGVPVSGRTSNDTLIVRGSGSGAPTSSIVFNGGYGVDAFENNASGFATIVFNGGLDADALLNNASGLASLDFYGDAGADVFVNHGGAIVILDFNGGADADTLINDGLALGHLNFDGGADSDILINSGDLLETLTFNGGADADILLNQGGQLGEIQFDGGADADVLINDGPVIDSLEFNGDAGNDRLWNRKGGIQIGSIVFMGDAGIDTLINDAAGIDEISFNGGADADILQNNGSVLDLSFDGGADADVLVNAGFAGTLTFDGGADADILLNRGGQVDVLDFMGDAGIDTLFNLGPVTSLTFEGGSDADVLQNNAIVDSLSFYGDVHFANGPSSLHDGADTLVNNGPVRTLSFVGGADNDIFQNNASVVELTFDGGADADTLVNNGGGITTLDFNGDAGADTLINNGSGIQTLHFDGGADADALRIEGREVGKVTFNGGLGSDSFTYNGVGAVASSVHFNGGAGNDFFAMRGIASAVTFDGGYGDDGVLVVGSGAMSLTGGDGDDFYRFVSNPLADVTLTDSYSGVADVSKDSLDFSSFTGGPVTLDLRLVDVWQSQGSGQLRIRLLDSMAIENIVGTPFADTIFGNARSNYIGGADFDEAFSGPVAAPRGVTQWVFLDFDSRSNSGVLDTLTGLPDIGEHDYTVAERELIRQRVEAIYRGPDLGAPWFDVRVVTSTASIPSTFILSNEFATVYFNQTPATGRPGGLASEVDPGNVNLGGSAAVQINGLLGGVINNVDSEETIEGDFDAFKRDVVPVNETEVGASKPSATSDNFVKLSSKVAAHELAHLLGLRHQDSFGPIGSGVHDIPGASSYKPTYTGPSGGVETIDHLIGSPASIGSTRFNDLNNLFFGEREAIKLAFANSNPSQTTTTNFGGNSALALAAPLSMVTLAVPNTLSSGQNATKNLYVQLSSVLGQIEVDSATMGTARSKSDWYSFTGRAGELINIDVFSNSVGRFGTGLNGAMISDDFVDTIVRVYNLNGQLVQYYDGLAENDDIFEPTDSSLIDLLLPADGTYYIEVDSFHRYSDALGNPMNPLSPLNPANPNNILAYPEIIDRFMDSINDTDAGRYQLVMYKFRKSSSSDMTDTLKGFGGADVINGGPGDIFVLAYDLGTTPTVDEGSAFTRSIVVDDRGASNWIGSTVDYGDGTGTQALSVSPSGVFSLNHVWADNGSYMVSVNIVNDIAQTLSHRLNVLVENVAPTASLSLSGPSTVSTETSITVSSTTSDPAGANDPLVLSWVITRNGEAFATQATGATYTFTPSLAGIYLIRLSATDGDGGTATATITVVSTTNAAPSLAITTPIDGAFGVSSSFTFNATDADVEDQAGTFVYAIQWGDGTTQTVSGPRLISVSHTYPAVSATGVFSIAATATDARGATSVLAKADFAVLGWTLMADPLHPSEAMLVIVGSQDSDSIKVKTKDDNYYKVSIRDRDDDVKRRGTVYGDVKRILVFAHGGNDRVTIEDDVEFTAEVWGGAGDDDIKGGSGNDILMGESGNDNLWGGNGRDIVIGGTGADRIHGDANDDILIAGFTAFEREFYQWAPSAFAASTRLTLDQQRAALESIMVEWASSRSYADRRNNIRGSGTGARLNGNDFLKMSDTVMTNNTVFDDSSVDQLWGDSGSDWFFANWNNDLGSVLDQIKDSSGSESQEDIDRWW